MDGFLEELLRFSRFSDPHPRTLSLPQTVSVAVGSMEESLRARIKLNGIAAKQWIRGDEDQLGFALRSLLRGLCREMTGEASVRVTSAGADLVIATEGGGGPQQKLAGLLDHAANGNAPPSLDFIMADALLRRNGGSTRLERTNDAVNVRLKFATAEPGTHE
jgi:hypothetical protein